MNKMFRLVITFLTIMITSCTPGRPVRKAPGEIWVLVDVSLELSWWFVDSVNYCESL